MSDEDYHAGISGLYATKTAMDYFQEADLVIARGREHEPLHDRARLSLSERDVTSISIPNRT